MNNTIDIKIVSGCEGEALYINDYRVSGPKPWGGGRVVIEDINGVGFIFKESRTPSQMYQIMLALN